MADVIVRAARAGDLRALKDAVRAHGTVNFSSKEGVTPLHWAAEQGHAECCRYLVRRGARLGVQTGLWGFTPLMLAVRGGHLATARYLVKHSLLEGGTRALDTPSKTGDAALHLAVAADHYSCAEHLLDLRLFGCYRRQSRGGLRARRAAPSAVPTAPSRVIFDRLVCREGGVKKAFRYRA